MARKRNPLVSDKPFEIVERFHSKNAIMNICGIAKASSIKKFFIRMKQF